MTSDEKIMKKCLGLAARAAANGDVPIGCIITDANGKIVARAFNSREKDAGLNSKTCRVARCTSRWSPA